MSLYKNKPADVRQRRVGEQIQRVLAESLISKKLYIPELENLFVNVSHVKLSADLRHAKVFISFPMQCDKKNVLKIFQDNAPAFTNLVAKKVFLKYTPTLKFYEDTFLDESNRTETLLNIAKEKENLSKK